MYPEVSCRPRCGLHTRWGATTIRVETLLLSGTLWFVDILLTIPKNLLPMVKNESEGSSVVRRSLLPDGRHPGAIRSRTEPVRRLLVPVHPVVHTLPPMPRQGMRSRKVSTMPKTHHDGRIHPRCLLIQIKTKGDEPALLPQRMNLLIRPKRFRYIIKRRHPQLPKIGFQADHPMLPTDPVGNTMIPPKIIIQYLRQTRLILGRNKMHAPITTPKRLPQSPQYPLLRP